MKPEAKSDYSTSAFDYALPAELIARYPAQQRDESRLMVLDRARGAIEHRRFRDIISYIPPAHALILNETRVFPARLLGTRSGGGEAEVLLLRPLSSDREWEALVRPGPRLRAGKQVRIADDFSIDILDVTADGNRIIRLNTPGDVAALIERYGLIPLPPYLEREADESDRERYQTVYATEHGSVAAPTAGLHFTVPLLNELQVKGVELIKVLLHVGVGTFRPVEAEDPAQHVMHEERYQIGEAAASAINAVRARGNQIWAVGTTVTRTLESAFGTDGRIKAGPGSTALFIRPGYQFQAVDHLLTNFHLPRSTLLMLVAALGGYELVMEAYRVAVAEKYRFYSYGDAMLIV